MDAVIQWLLVTWVEFPRVDEGCSIVLSPDRDDFHLLRVKFCTRDMTPSVKDFTDFIEAIMFTEEKCSVVSKQFDFKVVWDIWDIYAGDVWVRSYIAGKWFNCEVKEGAGEWIALLDAALDLEGGAEHTVDGNCCGCMLIE